jgi:hypothetical protein
MGFPVINHQHVNALANSLQLQTKLLLTGSEKH